MGRFMAAVRKLKEELEPDGLELDLYDTGTDMEIFPRAARGEGASFDKGSGVRRLDEKLNLRVQKGPNLVCGDTGSDVAMIQASLKLMCGDAVVDRWWDRIMKEAEEEAQDEHEDEEPSPMENAESVEEEDELTDEAKAQSQQEEE